MKSDIIPEEMLETHPWPAYIPKAAKVLIMGTFPPQSHRWSMDFYYPNRTNDFWFMMGLIFMGDRNALFDPAVKRFNLEEIKRLLDSRGIALSDTGRKVYREKGNASDKYLHIVEPVDLHGLLDRMPECHTVVTTGEKAAGVVAGLTGTPVPRMGEAVTDASGLTIWRMPSTSRAYPLRLESKAAYYEKMFKQAGVL